jgi:uncharacterized protein
MPNEFLKKYVINTLLTQSSILKSKTKLPNGSVANPRYFYLVLKKYVDDFTKGNLDPRIIAMSGLRGVGKTTLLASLFNDLDVEYKLYFSADEVVNLLNSGLIEFLEVYQETIGIRFEKSTNKFIFLIDEIHFDQNWTQVLKTIYDRYSNVMVVCTGSSALAFNTTTDLARRMIIEKIHPLCFVEYIQIGSRYADPNNTIFPIKGLKHEIKNILFQSKDFREIISRIKNSEIQQKVKEYYSKFNSSQVENFIKYGTMPNNLVLNSEKAVSKLNIQLFNRIIEKDFVEIGKFKPETVQKTKSLLLLLASSSSVSINSLSRALGLTSQTVTSILENLEKCDLLIKILPYGNAENKINKSSAYYFTSPVFRYSLLSLLNSMNTFGECKGALLEDIIAQILFRELKHKNVGDIYNDPNNGNADFIIKTLKHKIALEVGFGNKGKEQVVKSMMRFSLDYGIVVSNDEYYIWESEKIVRIPLHWFLLI